jgi:DNA-binding MarR family transcriptional regulator
MSRASGNASRGNKQRPAHASEQEAVLALLRTASILQRYYARIIEPHGLTYQQYNVLRILRSAGSRGLPTLAIRDQMIEQAPGITRLIDRLEADGLVRRERGAPDRRQVFCRITPAGLTVLRRLDAPITEADEAALGMLSSNEKRTLTRLLDRVRSAYVEERGDGEPKARPRKTAARAGRGRSGRGAASR